MSLWTYSGKDSSNQVVKGKVMADDEKGAKSRVEKMGIKCDSLSPTDEDLAKSENRIKETVSGTIKGLQETTNVSMAQVPTRAAASVLVNGQRIPVDNPSGTVKQRVLYGPGLQVQHEAMAILNNGGRVVHALMCPDGSGRPTVLLVVEYSEDQK